jgi:hypothetical protein
VEGLANRCSAHPNAADYSTSLRDRQLTDSRRTGARKCAPGADFKRHTFLFYANTTNFCSAPAMSDWAAAMVMAETTISAGQSKPHQ